MVSDSNEELIMQPFSINIVETRPQKTSHILSYKGLLTIGDFQEYFYMPIDSWPLQQYKIQWKEGIQRLKTENSSCLITSIYKLKTRPAIEWWPLYKEGEIVYIQNHHFGGKIMEERGVGLPPFNQDTCYLYVPPRETLSDDGTKVSEWSVPLKSMFIFLENIKI
jgi:hypothetical protein